MSGLGFVGIFNVTLLAHWLCSFYSLVSLEELLSSSGFMLLKKNDYNVAHLIHL